MEANAELWALRKALHMMGLDPEKVAKFVSDESDQACKAWLFQYVGLEEAKLALAGNAEGWRSVWRTLMLDTRTPAEKDQRDAGEQPVGPR